MLRSFLTLALVLFASLAQADLRAAFKSAIPATVLVEWTENVSVAENEGDTSTYVARVRADAVGRASGVILSSEGLVVTLSASVPKQGTLKVALADGSRQDAKVMVRDERTQLCLLKIDTVGLDAVELSDGKLEIGQEAASVYCVGPGEHRVARGIITALKRQAGGLPVEFFQCDLQLSPGSGGGPIVDGQGRLIGIQVASPAKEPGEGVLAAPARYVRELLDRAQLHQTVVIHGGYLGVQFSGSEEKRAVVESVHPNSPASKAGIEEGDLLVEVDGRAIKSSQDVLAAVGQKLAGEKVKVIFERNGERQEAEVELGRRERPQASNDFQSYRRTVTQAVDAAVLERVREGKLLLTLPDGKVTSIDLGAVPPQSQGKPLAVELAFPQPAPEAVKPPQVPASPKSPQPTRVWAKLLQEEKAEPAVVRVYRADADKKIDALTEEVKSLRTLVEKLVAEVQGLKGEK